MVSGAIVRFAAWLRSAYEFPVRVPIYLSPHSRLVTMDGSVVTASFFAPWDPNVEPYIRIATGDYPTEKAARGRDSALASYLHSLSHEIVHYHQWVRTGKTSERGVVANATRMVQLYSETIDHP